MVLEIVDELYDDLRLIGVHIALGKSDGGEPLLDVLVVLDIEVDCVVKHVLLQLGKRALHIELVRVGPPRFNDLEVDGVVVLLPVRVNELLVAELLLLAVNGDDLVLFGHEAVAV